METKDYLDVVRDLRVVRESRDINKIVEAIIDMRNRYEFDEDVVMQQILFQDDYRIKVYQYPPRTSSEQSTEGVVMFDCITFSVAEDFIQEVCNVEEFYMERGINLLGAGWFAENEEGNIVAEYEVKIESRL